MCGRFSATFTWNDLKAWWPVQNDMAVNYAPRFNIAPGQEIVTVGFNAEGAWSAAWVHWGFPLNHKLLINARREGIEGKPLFRQAYRHQRAIVPADGFYEWKKPQRQPFRFTMDQPFAIAAILMPDGERRWHVVLLTTQADEAVGAVHDRMPWILSPDQVPKWLNRQDTQYAHLPVAPVTWRVYPVTRRLNDAKNDDPDLILPFHEKM